VRKALILLLGVFLYSIGISQSKKVLFLGNSYTFVNDLPSLVQDIASSLGDSIIYDSNAPGGYTLEQHCTNAVTLSKIASQSWDFVVLQEQSQKPSFPPSQVAVEVYPFAKTLDSLIKVNNPCTKTVFYMTWGRKYGDQTNCLSYPPVCTYLGMQQRLYDSYMEMGDSNQAWVAPVGIAWRNSIQADSTLDLFASDFSHPNLYGSYLAACVFYSTFFQASTDSAWYPSTLDADTAAWLQNISDFTVLDSLSTWNIGEFEPNAAFSDSISGLDVFFTDSSTFNTTWHWDFGNSMVDSVQNPMSSYDSSGTYIVTLIVSDRCLSDTLSQQITVSTTTSQEEIGLESSISVLSNPVKGSLWIENKDFTGKSFSITDLNGKIQSKGIIYPGRNEIQLPSGIYLFKSENYLKKIIVLP
jgi:PKD repeat protein